MKIKKRYLIACVLLCIVSLALSIGIFYIEKDLALYTKLNSTVSSSWKSTDLFVTKVWTEEDYDKNSLNMNFSYIGSKNVVNGKYEAYGKEYWGNNIVINDDVKLGDKVSVYFKADDPEMVYAKVTYNQYFILVIAMVILDIVLVVVSFIFSKQLKENTFSDSPVTIMNIPIAVLIAGVVLGFFAGMLIGNLQINAAYTNVNDSLAAQYEAHEI